MLYTPVFMLLDVHTGMGSVEWSKKCISINCNMPLNAMFHVCLQVQQQMHLSVCCKGCLAHLQVINKAVHRMF